MELPDFRAAKKSFRSSATLESKSLLGSVSIVYPCRVLSADLTHLLLTYDIAASIVGNTRNKIVITRTGMRMGRGRGRERGRGFLLFLVINGVKPLALAPDPEGCRGWVTCVFAQPTHTPTFISVTRTILVEALSLALPVRRYPFLIRFTQHFFIIRTRGRSI